jgi:hypothetical protein
VLFTGNVVLSLAILSIRMIVVIPFSETSVLTKAIRRRIPEDGILHSECRENLKPYMSLTGWAL